MSLEYFWTSQENIPAGQGFDLFSAEHLAWLCAITCFIALSCALYRKKDVEGRRRLLFGFCAAMLVIEVIQDTILVATGQFLTNYLPLDLCGIAIFGECLCALKPGPIIKELCYCLFMPGALMALVFPNWNPLPAANFIYLHSFLLHAILVAFPLVQLAGGDFRPNPKNLSKCFAIGLAMCVPIYFIDKALNENFFFLNEPSPGSPLELFETWFGNPGYLLGLPIMLFAFWLILYLPFACKKARNRS